LNEIEHWLPVVGFEDFYEVSSLGNVRSMDRLVNSVRGKPHVRPGRIMSQVTVRSGHKRVRLVVNGRILYTGVHRVVLEAFVGPAPVGTICRHLNGVPSDNRLDNLAWGTHSENVLDQVRHGVHRGVRKTYCPRGHLYDGPNVRRNSNRRSCRACEIARLWIRDRRRWGREIDDVLKPLHADMLYREFMMIELH